MHAEAIPKARRTRGRIGRTLLLSFAALLLLGLLYETVSEALDPRRYPPPGEMVEMGGYSLHLYCTGEGSPTVLLEGGLGGGVATWAFVQPEVARFTRVCSYDRAGWAWSTGTAASSGEETVARLHTLLGKAGEKGPYILVGHSLGGLYSELYAADYPNEVAGMVLVEARHQEFARRLPPSAQGSGGTTSFMNRVVVPGLTRLGAVRILGRLGAVPGIPRGLPPGMMETAIRPSSQASAAAEQSSIPRVEEEARSVQIDLGNKPLVVVTRDSALSVAHDSAIWMETQRLFLRLSARSRLIEARGSGHMVPYDNPKAVSEAIDAAVSSACGR